MTVSDVHIYEGSGAKKTNLVFNVSLNRRPSSTVTVRYTAQVGTAGTGDFTTKTGTLTFKATNTTKQVPIALRPDNVIEGDETLSLVLSNPSAGFTITDGVGTATVHDDD
jgi:chitinase